MYRESRRGEAVFVCRMPDGCGEVVPSWMFDAAACAGMALGPPRASVAALAELRALLNALGSDDPAVAVNARPQEPDDEQAITREDKRPNRADPAPDVSQRGSLEAAAQRGSAPVARGRSGEAPSRSGSERSSRGARK